jgi:hypothetical protein
MSASRGAGLQGCGTHLGTHPQARPQSRTHRDARGGDLALQAGLWCVRTAGRTWTNSRICHWCVRASHVYTWDADEPAGWAAGDEHGRHS